MLHDLLLDAILSHFVKSAESGGFNGVSLATLHEFQPDIAKLRDEISNLVRAKKITAVFARLSINIYIKRFPDLELDKQLEFLQSEPLDEIGLYPTASIIEQSVDVSKWNDRPFSKALLLCEAQLAFRAFDFGTLERYISDPRYNVKFDDYMGWMSVEEEVSDDVQHPERDKIYLQSFGLGFDEKQKPLIVVFLRYLANLTPEHQQYWNSYLISGKAYLSEPYYTSSILGNFWLNNSVRSAIIEEICLIREMSQAIWGRSLFREISGEKVPIGLTTFLRPTLENFNKFIMSLDKLLSESIDVNFFRGKIALEEEIVREDGKIIVKAKGTIVLLQEWLSKEIRWSDLNEFKKVVIQPFREVRKLRQAPAHAFTTDRFSDEFFEKRKKLLWSVFNSLSNIRATLARHPRARSIAVPEWLDGKIDVF